MSAFWTRILDTYTVHQDRMKWVILVVCSLSLFGAAGIVTWHYVANRSAPDPQTANVEQVADYIKSDKFLEKSSVERGEYIEKLMGRYKNMTPTERDHAKDTMGNVLEKNRKLEKTFALSFASKQADEYNKLKTPAEKQQFIDRWLTMMELAHGGHERAKEEYQKNNPVSGNKQPTQDQRKHSVAQLRKSLPLVMSKTTAEDRAKLAKLVRDASYRMQERYGN